MSRVEAVHRDPLGATGPNHDVWRDHAFAGNVKSPTFVDQELLTLGCRHREAGTVSLRSPVPKTCRFENSTTTTKRLNLQFTRKNRAQSAVSCTGMEQRSLDISRAPVQPHLRACAQPAAPALCAPEQGSGKHAQMPNCERAEILAPPIDGELPKNLCGLQTLSETALPHQGRNALPHSCMESATVEGGSRASGSAGLPGSHPGMSKGRGAYDARVAEARPKATGLPLHPADTGPALRLRASS